MVETLLLLSLVVGFCVGPLFSYMVLGVFSSLAEEGAYKFDFQVISSIDFIV